MHFDTTRGIWDQSHRLAEIAEAPQWNPNHSHHEVNCEWLQTLLTHVENAWWWITVILYTCVSYPSILRCHHSVSVLIKYMTLYLSLISLCHLPPECGMGHGCFLIRKYLARGSCYCPVTHMIHMVVILTSMASKWWHDSLCSTYFQPFKSGSILMPSLEHISLHQSL